MMNLITTFEDKKAQWFTALLEHLQISMLALLSAMVIAIPLAILISRNKKLSEAILQITGVFQTIPSLALLGLFIPIMGIGKLPAVAALVIYGIFPILQNTITGLWEIDPALEEAATAFGMTRLEKLKKYQLSLATPMIISGLRTSVVMIIGTATLAALVGAGGLGSFILLGIDRNNSALILIGAISSALLAVMFSSGIKFLEKQRLRHTFLILAVITAILVGTVFSPMAGSDKKVVIAGKLGAEPEILINMYKELIENESDIEVVLKPNFGKTTFLYEALKAGEIDIYPEFTGTVVTSLLSEQGDNLHDGYINDAGRVYEHARDAIKKQDNLALLEPMKYQNTYALAVPAAFAKEKKLEKISDLIKVEDELQAGFTLEFNDRQDGRIGLEQLYGLSLNVKTMEPSLRYQTIGEGTINLIDAYSTDSQLKKYNLMVLEDDKHLFPPYQGAPLMRQETLKKYPALKKALDKLKGKITEEEMQDMNYQVDMEGKSPKAVAHNYLVKAGLI